jgi:hypothetical membrane protein
METSTKSVGEQPMAIRLLLAGGAIGPLLFIVVFLIEGATRPHYSVWQDAVSALSLGEGGWMQITNFIVCGALVFGFAIGLRRVLRIGRGSTWGPILLGLVGIGLIGAGIFVTDPGQGYPHEASLMIVSVHGTIHSIISLFFVFISLPAACFVLARHYAADPALRGWAWYSVITGLLVVVFVVLTIVATALNGPAGLTQRIFIIVGWIWIAVQAIRLMSRSSENADICAPCERREAQVQLTEGKNQ